MKENDPSPILDRIAPTILLAEIFKCFDDCFYMIDIYQNGNMVSNSKPDSLSVEHNFESIMYKQELFSHKTSLTQVVNVHFLS